MIIVRDRQLCSLTESLKLNFFFGWLNYNTKLQLTTGTP